MNSSTESERFQKAALAFETIHQGDPSGVALPHARTVVAWVERLRPDASEALRLAARAQHLGRWEVPRSTYPEGRDGYLRWRRDLSERHAEQAAGLLTECGYPADTVARVGAIMRKRGRVRDPEVQVLEDALCLAFIERQLDDFRRKHEDAKLAGILQKTWAKMSPQGREAALALDLPGPVRELIARSLG